MAFDTTKLQKVTATTPGVWHYVAPSGDNAAAIKADDYFLSAASRLVVGDMIMVADPANGTGQVLTVVLNDGSANLNTAYLTNV